MLESMVSGMLSAIVLVLFMNFQRLSPKDVRPYPDLPRQVENDDESIAYLSMVDYDFLSQLIDAASIHAFNCISSAFDRKYRCLSQVTALWGGNI